MHFDQYVFKVNISPCRAGSNEILATY